MVESSQPVPQRDEGVVFPLVDGTRSSTATGRAVLADAARVLDTALAEHIAAERDWRRGYLQHVRRLVESEVRSADRADAVPAAGLASVHDRFEFVRSGEGMSLAEALRSGGERPLETVVIQGTGAGAVGELAVPYRGQLLAGDSLHWQLDRWVGDGIVEPSFAEAIHRVLANPGWLDLSDLTVAVLGAGAEMGPLDALCDWGASVLAVDLPGAPAWERIVASAREGAGRVLIPVRGAVDEDRLPQAAGADLITETPEVAAWLATVDGALTIGNYTYADGATNLRLAVAVDALIAHLLAQRPGISTAVLATPTDVFAVPEDAVEMAARRFSHRRMSERIAARASGGRLFAPQYTDVVTAPGGLRFGIADSLIPQQGPNYALAKRLHQWRARAARAAGAVSSVNVAPATRTRSVTKNRVLAAAYAGAGRFGVEIFEPPTSNRLMAAMLVHDLRNDKAASHPAIATDHPLELLIESAAHAGLWRLGFEPRSALGVAALFGLPTAR